MSIINVKHPARKAGDLMGFFRPIPKEVRERTDFNNTDPETGEVYESMTRQSEMASCDIHNILKQFSQTGFEQLVRERAAQGQYADLTSLPDYQEALNVVLDAQAAFAALPSQVRDRFHNNPEEFIAFVGDPANQDEAIRLGLAVDTRTPEPPPTKVEVINPEPKAPDPK